MIDKLKNAKPQYIFDRITDITIDDLKKMGVKLVAIDLDNTTVFDCTNKPIKGVRSWLTKVKEASFKVAIISNSFAFRAKMMGKKFDCPAYGPADKPDTKMMIQAASDAGVKPHEMALSGDRLFTDVVGANAFGAVSVLVKPYKKEFMIPWYWKKARQDEIDFLKTINIKRDSKTIYYK